jgi:hypothetical protein
MVHKKTRTNNKYSIKKSKSKSKNKSKSKVNKDTKSRKKNLSQQSGGRVIGTDDFKTRLLREIKIVKNPDDILDVPIKKPPRPECTIL